MHAPSIYDFRQHKALWGPIADVIPSSTVFDMYPAGLTSIAEYIEKRGYRAQLINLAYRMLYKDDYDVEKTIAKSRARVFAIDLHWLPHAHGSIEIARIVKKHHPEKPIIMGGLTASYYHQQLIKYDCVDYVLRGDSVEEPFYRLLEAISEKGATEDVPNLTYKDNKGKIKENALTFVPTNLDYVNIPSYQYVAGAILKYRSIHNPIPYLGWLEYPVTMLLTSRGCSYNCGICGGGKEAYQKVCGRNQPAFRSPEKLIEDVRIISSFSKAPIFVVHDLRHGGEDYAEEFLKRLSREKVKNEFVFELFKPASDEFLNQLNQATAKYSLQVSIESQKESIRKVAGKFKRYSNADILETLRRAFRNGCQKLDLFFMIGLPKQSYEDAVGCVDFSREIMIKIYEEFGPTAQVVPYVAPYAPFLDPGSAIFENTQKYGYTKLWDKLEDYRTAMLAPSWKYMISYETKWMNRNQLVAATYAAARGLNELKYETQIINSQNYNIIKANLEKSEKILNRVDELVIEELGYQPKQPISPGTAKKLLEKLKREMDIGGTEFVLCGREEMRWPTKGRFRNIFSLIKLCLRFLLESRKPNNIIPPLQGEETYNDALINRKTGTDGAYRG